jgi:crotonobetaine/carnitine-CoA ligase
VNWAALQDPATRTIGQVLRRQADEIGDDVFLMDPAVRLTYSQVNERANQIAHGLRSLGVERGDRVSLLMANSAEMACVALASSKLGAIWVPINTSLKATWLRDALEMARASVVVADHDLYELGLRDVPPGKHVVVTAAPAGHNLAAGASASVRSIDDVLAPTVAEPTATVDYRDVSAVMWTSGTTGKPKGIMQTHSSWLMGAQALSRSRDAREGDVFYGCLPMFNSGGWSLNVFGAMVAGLPIGIDPGFSASKFWARCAHYGATQVITLGAMYEFLLKADVSADEQQHSVRVCACIPIPPDKVEEFQERFAIPTIWNGYAQSELMFMTGCAVDRKWKPGSCGVAIDRIHLAILDAHDQQVGIGDVGEICVRPKEPHLMFAGYFDAPELTLEATRNLWYHTGDLGYLDEDGELFFADRKQDVMRFAGRTISASDVERAALAHDEVARAAACGIASEAVQSETEVLLTVVLKPGSVLAEAEIARFINDTAPYYLVPRYIDIVESLPLTPTGKVEKRTLKERGVSSTTWDRTTANFELRKR